MPSQQFDFLPASIDEGRTQVVIPCLKVALRGLKSGLTTRAKGSICTTMSETLINGKGKTANDRLKSMHSQSISEISPALQSLHSALLSQIQEKQQYTAMLQQNQRKQIGEDVARWEAYREDKRKKLEEEIVKKREQECTFQPKLIKKGGKENEKDANNCQRGKSHTQILTDAQNSKASKTNETQPIQKRRNFNQFLRDQVDFTRKVSEKRDQLKEQLERSKQVATYKPKINSHAGQFAERKRTAQPIHERLYAMRNGSPNKDDSMVRGHARSQMEGVSPNKTAYAGDSELTFHPRITKKSQNMDRRAPIDELLYKDALRRQQKRQAANFSMGASNNTFGGTRRESMVSVQPTAASLNNEKYVAQKFIKEYFGILEKVGASTAKGVSWSEEQFRAVLREMHFITIAEPQDQTSRTNQPNESYKYVLTPSQKFEVELLNEAYNLLSDWRINARNVCVFLLALVGVYHINPVNFEEDTDSDQVSDQKGQQGSQRDRKEMSQGQFSLEEAEGRRLQRRFQLFFRNRMSGTQIGSLQQSVSRAKNTQNKHQNQTGQRSFHPTINPHSQALAARYRQQMLEQANELLQQYPELEAHVPEDGVISHADLLVLHKYAKNVEHARKRQQQQNRTMDECTFKPQLIASQVGINMNQIQSELAAPLQISTTVSPNAGSMKSLQLYNSFKKMQSRKQSLQASRQNSQINTIDQQCTFAPKINQQRNASNGGLYAAKQIDSTLLRMKRGRQEHEEKKKMLERGEKIAHKVKTDQRTDHLVASQSSFCWSGSASHYNNNNHTYGATPDPMTAHDSPHDSPHSVDQQSSQQSALPLLILDINLAPNLTDRLVLYSGDQHRLPVLAGQFARRHGMCQDDEARLLEMLKGEVGALLEKIDEGDQDEV